MGRPIKKIFIGERGTGNAGGEGVESVTVGGVNNSTGYTDLDALTITAPDLVGGIQAVAHVLETAGQIDSVVVTVQGTGYTSVPTVTAPTGTLGTTTLTAVLTTTGAAVIAASAFVTATDLTADITAQKGSTTYKVTTSEGTLDCTLVAATPAAVGEMAIIATDSSGKTYWVTKLYNNTVRVSQFGATGWEFADGTRVKWADTAVLNDSVKITS